MLNYKTDVSFNVFSSDGIEVSTAPQFNDEFGCECDGPTDSHTMLVWVTSEVVTVFAAVKRLDDRYYFYKLQ